MYVLFTNFKLKENDSVFNVARSFQASIGFKMPVVSLDIS